MLSAQRLDPASLPAAGRISVHDSANEDYRFVLAHRSSSPTKKLQTTQWAGPSDCYLAKKPEPLTLPPAKPPALSKPDHFYIHDIPAAAPTIFPGLTLNLPSPSQQRAGSSTWPGAVGAQGLNPKPSPAAAAGAGCGSVQYPSPPRITNPQNPQYKLPPGPVTAYPMGPPNPARPSHTRSLYLDTHTLDGAHTRPAVRERKDPSYPTLDYSDVCGPTSPLRVRLLRDGRKPRTPPDTRPLGMWGTSGDTGNMLQTQRTPTDPLAPVYRMHGRVVADEPAAKHPSGATARTRAVAGAGGGGAPSPTQGQVGGQQGGGATSMAHAQSHKGGGGGGGGAVSITDVMGMLGQGSNQSVRSPVRRGQGGNLRELHTRKPGEVATLRL